MPQSAQEWWDDPRARTAGVERERNGSNGVDGFRCRAVETDDSGYIVWRDERAVTDVLDVPRMQAMRWGDGQEHLHWWVMGRPTGAEQLRGSFLASWDEVLPARPLTDSRVDLDAVAQRLIDLAGGEIPG